MPSLASAMHFESIALWYVKILNVIKNHAINGANGRT